MFCKITILCLTKILSYEYSKDFHRQEKKCSFINKENIKMAKNCTILKMEIFIEEENLFEWNACLAKKENVINENSSKENGCNLKLQIFKLSSAKLNEFSWPRAIIFWFIQKSIFFWSFPNLLATYFNHSIQQIHMIQLRQMCSQSLWACFVNHFP